MAKKGSWLLYNRIPFIGGWLRRREATNLARDSSPEAAAALAGALSRSTDDRVLGIARAAIAGCSDQPSIDAICATWVSTRSPVLLQIIQSNQWIASASWEVRVVTALACGRTAVVTTIPAGGVEPLIAACSDVDPSIAQEARRAIVALTNPEGVDRLCQRWSQSRDEVLDQVVWQGKYVAREPLDVRVLTALRTGQAMLLKGVQAPAVPMLVQACSDDNSVISSGASAALRQLEIRDTQDAVCRLFIEQNDAVAKEISLQCEYIPRDEHERAAFLFLTGQWERYNELDFDRRLLQAVYETAAPSLKSRITSQLRQAGRTDFLTVLSGGDYRSRAAVMTPDESAFVIEMLAKHGEWEKLWLMAFELSFFATVKIVKLVSDSRWQPSKPDDRRLLEELGALVRRELPTGIEQLSKHVPPATARATARVSGRVRDVAFSPWQPWIAIAGSRQVVVWDFQKGEPQESFRGFQRSVGTVAFTEENQLICAEGGQAGRESVLHFWSNGHRSQVPQSDMITSVSPAGGSKVIVTRRDHHISLWDAATGLTIRERSLEFWPRASRVAADGTEALLLHDGVTLIGLPDMLLKAATDGRIRGGVSKCAAFAPDRKSQIIGNFNGDIFITSQHGNRLASRRRKLAKCSGQVQGVEVLRDQRVVIVAGSEGRIDFISWDNETHIGSVHTSGERLTSIHISPSGDFMAVGDSDSSMSFWDMRVMQLPLFFSLSFAQAKPAHLAAVQALASDRRLPAPVRHAVAFMGSMLRHRFRFDIEIAELQSIRVGQFDIAIE